MPDRPPCPTCGTVHAKCKGHNRRGGACGMNPLKGQDVCDRHGGKSPQAKAAAARRDVEDKARAELVRRWQVNGEQPVDNPLAELARVAGEIVGFKDLLRDQVQALNGLLTYWTERDFTGYDGQVIRTESVEQVRATVAAYERAQERAAKVLATMVKLDIAGRMLELRTAQAVAIVEAVRAGLNAVDMAAEIRKAALSAIADQLEQITLSEPTPKELTA